MADMFWEIPASDVKSAVQWALHTVRKKHRATNLSFSVSRESNHLDRIGRSTAAGFTVVHEACVSRFVDFDLDDNVLFTAGGVILAQGGKGVPIGGFISAQAAEIWAIWKEHCVFSDQHRSEATTRWQQIIDAPPKEWEDLSPPTVRMPNSVSVTETSDFSMAPRPAATMRVQGLAMASPQSHLVSELALSYQGFRGWWEPLDRLIASICVDGTDVLVASSTPWDGSARGRLATIIRHTPNRQKGKVGEFFKCFDPLQGVVGEILNPPVCPLQTADQFQRLSGFPPRPFVLLSRYRDNIYMAFANIPRPIRPAVQFACAALLRTIYQLPLKWEEHGAAVVWGEGMIRTGLPGIGFSLLRKGTSSCLQQVVEGEWRRWVHPLSPNAQLVWRSLLPALFSKSLWYAWSAQDVIDNLQSLVWNLVLGGYPQSWWKPSFRRCWEKYRLIRVFPLNRMHDWIRQARKC